MGRKKSFVSDNSIEILNEQNEEDMETCGFTEAKENRYSGYAGIAMHFFSFIKATPVYFSSLITL